MNLDKQIQQTPMDSRKKVIKIPSIIFLILGIIASVGISYLIVDWQRDKDYTEIEKKIDEVFHGKDEICDYQKSIVGGELKGESFNCTEGGFTIARLHNTGNTFFQLWEYTSGDMAYKVAETSYIPGTNYGYGLSTPGYTVSNNRPSIQACYDSTMSYLINQPIGSYVAGYYDKIKSIGDIFSDFYFLKNTLYSTTPGRGSLQNSQYIIWWDVNFYYYGLTERPKLFNKRWATYSGIGVLFVILIYFIIKYRRKIKVQIN